MKHLLALILLTYYTVKGEAACNGNLIHAFKVDSNTKNIEVYSYGSPLDSSEGFFKGEEFCVMLVENGKQRVLYDLSAVDFGRFKIYNDSMDFVSYLYDYRIQSRTPYLIERLYFTSNSKKYWKLEIGIEYTKEKLFEYIEFLKNRDENVNYNPYGEYSIDRVIEYLAIMGINNPKIVCYEFENLNKRKFAWRDGAVAEEFAEVKQKICDLAKIKLEFDQ